MIERSKIKIIIASIAVILIFGGLMFWHSRAAHAQQSPRELTAKQALRLNNRLIEARLADKAFRDTLADVKKELGVDDTWQPVSEGDGVTAMRPPTPDELKIIEQQKAGAK